MDKEELKKLYKKYAEKNKIKLNPNEAIVDRVIEAELEIKKEKGERYCPCRALSGNKERDKKNICPCFWHLDEIKKDGHCLCNLFVK